MGDQATRIYVISDSTGETARRVVKSALVQFDRPELEVVSFARVRQADEIEAIFKKAQDDGVMVVYTLVDPDLRETVGRLSQSYHVEVADPIGSLLAKIGAVLGEQPEGRPGIMRPLDEEYFRRIEAVEYAVKHDDGQMPQGLHRADVVLVGLSRTSKTPVCTYLAQQGWKAANVPIVLGIPLPKELFEIPQHKIYALTINVASLVSIRNARLMQLNMPADSDYGMREHIVKELKYARGIFRENPCWPVVDVSHRALEETSAILTWMLEERTAAHGAGTLKEGESDRFSGLYTEN